MSTVKISALGPLKKKIVGNQEIELKDDKETAFSFLEKHFEILQKESSRYNFVINGRMQKGTYILQENDSIVVLKMGGAG